MATQELSAIAQAQSPNPASESNSAKLMEFLSFCLGGEEYGINIMKVQEIRNYEKVTVIANAPEHIKGVMNLRGLIVPIIDMRLLLKVGEPKYDPFTIVIVLNVNSKTIGMVVDSVSDVISLPTEAIKPAPELSGAGHTNHVEGIGTIDGRMVILLDIDGLMTSDEMGLLEAAAA